MREATPAAYAALAGWGLICATGKTAATLHAALQANRSALAVAPRFSAPLFQTNIVGAAPREESDDPAWELAATALQEAVGGVARLLRTIPAARLGLVLSTTKANIEALERISAGRPCSASARHHLRAEALAADLAAEFGARGPVQNISNACVSGLVALVQGAKLIQRGTADAVLVVGVDHLSAFVVSGFSTLKAIDPRGCRPFDRHRCGLSPGEAGAAIVLLRPDLAPAGTVRISGWGASNDANHMTGPARDGAGLAQAIRLALTRAQLAPAQVDYINAHGTGTAYNDAMESAALRSIFGTEVPAMGGLKGMFGHTLGAAGVLETIACAMALQDQFLPGTPRLEQAETGFPSRLMKQPRPAPGLKHVLKLNTGFGGMNGALLLEQTGKVAPAASLPEATRCGRPASAF
ncbi:MAG TPA: beta-ketoacyl-[acyl-carrier-protein] synthase family protein [Verrucomicrobiota bacterium]|nr:beta-ketoacyl-[acyl-carrier-protein] synthase family protein [Verrucomicrobiota bacterium]HNT15093.1 beta-ketoacyl-[acyl-carrier-protein] synthase family protein [Verrucomicrobiota bacterium]